MKRYDIYGYDCPIATEEDPNGEWCRAGEAESALTAAQARIEKLTDMVMWMTEHHARLLVDRPATLEYWADDGNWTYVDTNGTTAAILAAVEKAMGE